MKTFSSARSRGFNERRSAATLALGYWIIDEMPIAFLCAVFERRARRAAGAPLGGESGSCALACDCFFIYLYLIRSLMSKSNVQSILIIIILY